MPRVLFAMAERAEETKKFAVEQSLAALSEFETWLSFRIEQQRLQALADREERKKQCERQVEDL